MLKQNALILQLELNGLTTTEDSEYREQIFATCSALLRTPFVRGEHQCKNPEMDEFLDCGVCQQSAFVYQTLAHLAQQLCPKNQMSISAAPDEVLFNATSCIYLIFLNIFLTTD